MEILISMLSWLLFSISMIILIATSVALYFMLKLLTTLMKLIVKEVKRNLNEKR